MTIPEIATAIRLIEEIQSSVTDLSNFITPINTNRQLASTIVEVNSSLLNMMNVIGSVVSSLSTDELDELDNLLEDFEYLDEEE